MRENSRRKVAGSTFVARPTHENSNYGWGAEHLNAIDISESI